MTSVLFITLLVAVAVVVLAIPADVPWCGETPLRFVNASTECIRTSLRVVEARGPGGRRIYRHDVVYFVVSKDPNVPPRYLDGYIDETECLGIVCQRRLT